jgi:hypothetical protein
MVGGIAQIVATNEALQREKRDLTLQNEQLNMQLREIGAALDRITGGRARGGGASFSASVADWQ